MHRHSISRPFRTNIFLCPGVHKVSNFKKQGLSFCCLLTLLNVVVIFVVLIYVMVFQSMCCAQIASGHTFVWSGWDNQDKNIPKNSLSVYGCGFFWIIFGLSPPCHPVGVGTGPWNPFLYGNPNFDHVLTQVGGMCHQINQAQ